MFKSICEVKTSVAQLDACIYAGHLQLYGQQFPCIPRIASTKSLLSSCALYNVHEKSLTEEECELSLLQKRERIGKTFLH